ncbi:ATP-binding protein [Mongoliitalea daihaiensis]|uniref:ATP-binding protein n=1 Tax=Mongoliitalea daihaiensis TaxID=2782006 RepID=UPI001F37B0C2|nr:ATP-binding protein [Mongoliitalea daihaiensis]UJP64527.1 PAS domain-containing protein [Mongoliitalea daihaiensis]
MKTKDFIEATYKIPVMTGIVSFLISLVLTQFITYRDYEINQNLEQQQVIQEAQIIEKKINTILNQAYAAASTLQIAYELMEKDTVALNNKAAQILEMFPSLDIIQLVVGGEITYVYPLVGNEVVIGYNILDDPKTSREAALAIERKKMFFAGPFELKQGGEAIVGRLPIFKNNQFWGFSVAIIKMESFQYLLRDTHQLEELYYIQFSKIKPNETDAQDFLPIPADVDTYNGYKFIDSISDGDWLLTIQLKKSNAFQPILFSFILRILLSISLGIAAYFLAKQPKILEDKVAKATRRWKRSNKRFQIATKATSDFIWDWSLTSGRVYRSENFEKLFGYPLTVFTNDTNFWNDHIHPDDLQRVLKHLNKVKSSKETYWEEEFRFLKSNGQYAYVVDKGIILRDKEGNPIRIIGATQDITKAKNYERQLIKEKELLNSLLDHLAEGIIMLNFAGKITLSNKKARDLLQINQNTLDFREIISLNEFLSVPAYQLLIRDQNPLVCILKGEKVRNVELAIQRANGPIHVLVSGEQFTVDEREKVNILIVLHDISDIREKEVDLAHISEELKVRAEALELSNQELERFAYVTSHNLQEPLRMVGSFLKLINTKYGALLDEKGRSYIQYAIEGADRMKQLIMDVLDYSLADIGDEQTDLSLQTLIEEVKILERSKIQETHASITCDQSLEFRGDKIQIRQLLQNLINNSLKFKKGSESLQIWISGESKENYWLIKVQDNGIGIKETIRKKIFNIFEKDQEHDNHSGFGVGLAICKKIIAKHNGKIWIESKENMGTTVYFTIEK